MESGGSATATVQYRYGTAPDGSIRIVGATVSRSETIDVKTGKPVERPLTSSSENQVTGEPQAPKLALSPSDEADVFGLTPEEREVVRKLQAEDLNVRIHEAQHFRNAGGITVGNPDYSYTQGPDGQFYATAGSVNVQTSSNASPEQAEQQNATLQRAATAPADASAQDFFAAGSITSNNTGSIVDETA